MRSGRSVALGDGMAVTSVRGGGIAGCVVTRSEVTGSGTGTDRGGTVTAVPAECIGG